ncbi:hypothetical protein [Paenibacillus sp. 481]|uniref:hypothetical protein n=1 Tax=Paenibacillus sp. 481 TaxID=2835869 RepID=UPI001E2DE6C9|nr:hypothetical protein [Paenibacillus sp. 481]UHA74273.1 hypothetical protein KIK04_03825 [Paenibacillus sp. 481]
MKRKLSFLLLTLALSFSVLNPVSAFSEVITVDQSPVRDVDSKPVVQQISESDARGEIVPLGPGTGGTGTGKEH